MAEFTIHSALDPRVLFASLHPAQKIKIHIIGLDVKVSRQTLNHGVKGLDQPGSSDND